LSKRLSITLLLITLIAITVYVAWNREDFRRIKDMDMKFFLHQSMLSGLVICVNGYVTKVFLVPFGVRLKPKEWFGLALLTTLGNYLTPFRGGMAFKGIYLKKRLKLPYSTFASTVAASYILVFLMGGVLGIGTLLMIFRLYGTIQWKLLSFLFIVSATMIVILIFRPTIENPRNRSTRILKNTLDGWRMISRNIALVIKVSVLITLNFIIICARLYYGYKMFRIDIGILPAFAMSLMTGFAILIAVTPGNLGIQETVIGFISKLMGPGFNEGFMVAGVLRAVNMVVVCALGPVFAYPLFKRSR
jgi:uncharacterized membrane protein YbhN (UPF0104 family)